MLSPRHSSDRFWRSLAAAGFAVFTAQAALVCDSPEYNFGSLPDTDLGFSHIFEVRNAGVDSVVITSVLTSCDCLAATLTNRSLRPGDHVPVDMRFTFGREAGPQLRAVHLAYRGKNAPESEPARVLTLLLRGAIIPPVLRSPNRLDLGLAPPGSIVTGKVSLLSGRCGPFALNAVGLTAYGARADYEPNVTGTNHAVRLLIPVPARTGSYSGLAMASTDLAEMPTVPILYAGHSAPALEVRPPVLTVRKGAPIHARLTVSSPYGTPFRVLTAVATDPRVAVTVAQDATGAHVSVTAETFPDTFTTALIRLATDHPVCRMIEVPIRVLSTIDEFR